MRYRGSTEWFKSFDELSSILSIKDRERDGLARKAKIAIIDTGVDPEILQDLHRYKDFLTTSCKCLSGKPCIDKDIEKIDRTNMPSGDKYSHGTRSVKYIQRINSAAQVHLARTFEAEEATEETPNLVAQVRMTEEIAG